MRTFQQQQHHRLLRILLLLFLCISVCISPSCASQDLPSRPAQLAQAAQDQDNVHVIDATATDREMSAKSLNLQRSVHASKDSQPTDSKFGAKEQKPKRVLVYCMQSSGCSIFMMVLGQKLKSVTIVDLYIVDPVPEVIDADPKKVDWYALKMTFRGVERGGAPLDYIRHLEDMKKIYKPDITILYMRHPADNLISLRKHTDPKVPIAKDRSDTCNTQRKPDWVSGYAYRCGDPASKLRNLETMFKNKDRLFDAVFTYHDLHFGHDMIVDTMTRLGYTMSMNDFQLHRGIQDIMKFAHNNFKSHNKVRFGPGGIPNHAAGITKDGFHTYAPYNSEILKMMHDNCPTVFTHFEALDVPNKK